VDVCGEVGVGVGVRVGGMGRIHVEMGRDREGGWKGKLY